MNSAFRNLAVWLFGFCAVSAHAQNMYVSNFSDIIFLDNANQPSYSVGNSNGQNFVIYDNYSGAVPFFISTHDQVGINTQNPQAPLDVEGSNPDVTNFLLGNSTSGVKWNFQTIGSAFPGQVGNLNITTLGNSGFITVQPNGYVGIDMASPTVPLDVNGGVRAGSAAVVSACGLGQANGEGTQRYNYTTHNMEFCNGTGWTAINPTGSWCGYTDFSTGLEYPCQSYYPYFSCPPGYSRVSIEGTGSGSDSGPGNNSVSTSDQVGYTCIKQ